MIHYKLLNPKCGDIKPYFEHKNIHDYRERDIKGIVDGFKYTDRKEKSISRSLLKINHVEKPKKYISGG